LIHLDTSLLIAALTGHRRAAPALRQAIHDGERLAVSTLALYEWLRGPRTDAEITAQEALFPAAAAVPFGPEEVVVAAATCRVVRHARRRTIDVAIAACAITRGARLWTLNTRDFADIPHLDLVPSG
jgi:predicted nucleic acid-binding protein